jgi:hypothetical protein
MFIQTQPTPNPHSLMFLPGQKVMEVRKMGHYKVVSGHGSAWCTLKVTPDCTLRTLLVYAMLTLPSRAGATNSPALARAWHLLWPSACFKWMA